MSKIKHTKNALKAQRDALRRFERYLPTLQLKKQQLQMEVRRLEAEIEKQKSEEQSLLEGLKAWEKLFSEPLERPWWPEEPAFEFAEHVRVEEVRTSEGNVAGVAIPVLEDIVFKKAVPDLFATPAWVDDGLAILETLMRLRAELAIRREQHRLLREELRITTQRVNLFEKVKIPECKENIRVIRIFLGDEQTAGVARAKIAKAKSVEKVRAA
jgi:V/A-type H+-transporting ATPase subunit D